MKALVLSGGGSKGAFTGGMLEYMKMVQGREYELYVATSTGTLIQTLASLNKFDRLKEAYTSIQLEDIYKTAPFKQGDDPDNPKLNALGMAYMHFVEKQPTFGDSKNLKELIYKFFPEELYTETLNKGVNLVPCVTNITKRQSEYYPSQENNYGAYKSFCDWTWISCNAVPFTSLVKRNGDYYADGGFKEHMPIRKAIEMGATEIDAITTKPENWIEEELDFGRNPLALLAELFDIVMEDSSEGDIEMAKKIAVEKEVKLNIYYAPRLLTKNSMYFDKEVMNEWWDEGYEYAKGMDNGGKMCCKTITLKPKKKRASRKTAKKS
jgi:predicted patatin/cPLA2 family phospholipase